MRKLQRGAAPACLSKFRHGANNWNDLSERDKVEIWQQLEAMQGERCAYCENQISQGKRQIEHFRQKASHVFPKGTFLWSNLFGSCMRKESCGIHKDNSLPYDHTLLIKPDGEDPEHYLVFDQHGGINPRKNLNETDYRRAQETIRIFNLDTPLRAIRRSQVRNYVETAEAIAELVQEGLPEAQGRQLLEQEIAATAHLPFATAIKHVLTRQG